MLKYTSIFTIAFNLCWNSMAHNITSSKDTKYKRL